MPPARGELAELLAFREALRADPALCDAYAEAKQRIVDAAPDGEANQLYTVRKGDFVLDSLYRLGIRRPPADRPQPLRPGATIGIMGGGQLGRMLGFSARAMGYRIIALDPDPACPTAAVADEIIVGRYDDADAARRLGCDERRRHVRAGARGARGGCGGRRGSAAPSRARARCARRRTGSRSAGSSGTSGSGRPRGARSVASPRPRRPRTRSATRAGSSSRWAGTTDGARRGSRRARTSRRRSRRWAARTVARCCSRRTSTSRPSSRASSRADRDGRTLAFPPSRNVHDAGILVESVAPAPVHPLQAYDASEIAERLARSLDLVRAPDRRAVRAPRRRADDQRARAARPQLRPLDDRGGGHLAVRAARARDRAGCRWGPSGRTA